MASETNLEKLHEEFLQALKEKGRSNSTILAYGKDIEQLIELLQSKDISEINDAETEHLREFKKSLEEKNYTNKSISRKINSVRTFYRFLISNDYADEDIATNLEHPKIENTPPRILSEIEYRALRDAARGDTRLYSIIELLLQTGIRIGELTRIKLDDINNDQDDAPKTLQISEYGSHDAREVPLNEPASKAIRKYQKIRPKNAKSEHLFITKTGNPLLVRNIRTSIDRAFERAGIKDAKVNDLRNTFIAHHLARGTSLVVVSKLVGHKRISTTEKYLGLVEGDEGKKVELEEL